MTEYENNIPVPDQESPVQNPVQEHQAPQDTTYAYHYAPREESPFADSPYVMNHAPKQQNTWQEQPWETAKAVKKKKPKKEHPGIWKKLLAVLLVIALMVGACSITAAVVNESWEDRMEDVTDNFSRQMDKLQKQIESVDNKQTAANTSIAAGAAMTPSQVYAYNVNSVVAISANVKTTIYGQATEGVSTGSGFIMTEDGYVITNAHVVDGASDVTVTTHDGMEYSATVEGADTTNDVAVLKVEATGLPAVTMGSSDALVIGDMVVAIGNPLGTLSSTQTVGYVSGKDRDITTDGSIISMIQTDAAINSGNSGGPLFNMAGEVVGITTAKYSGTSTSGASIEGIGFAIPIDDVIGIIDDLIDYGYVTGAYMGITVTNTDEESASMFGLPTGAYVMSVEKGGSADRAGIQAKDIIIDLGGYKVTGITSLTRALRNFKAGDVTTVTLIRSGGQMELEITLDEKPQNLNQSETAPEGSSTMPDEGDPNDWYEYFRRYFGDTQP